MSDVSTEFDVLVLGTGAAGLTAAVTAAVCGARVAVFEKHERVGGTSAYSGGMIWVPANPYRPPHRADSREDALTYLHALSNDMLSDELIEAYVDAGPEMTRFLEEHTPIEWTCVPDFPDFHPEQPGAASKGGRTLECPPYPWGELGEWQDRVQVSPYFPDTHIAVGETTLGQPVPLEIPPEVRQRRIDNDERGLGLSLIARLLRGCLDRGVPIKTEYRAVELVMEDGRVAGVVFETSAGTEIVHAPNVVLATGGFEWDEQLRRSFLRGPLTHPVSVPTNTGDSLRMAMRVGAMLGNMREAWWMPVIEVPESVIPTGRQLLTAERTFPGSIMVNRSGRRFTNEAANYNAFGAAFHEQDTTLGVYKNLPCWMVFSQRFLDHYGLAGDITGGAGVEKNGDRPHAQEWIIASDTFLGLAEKLGLPPGSLEATVERFNAHARAGHDPDFHRGDGIFDRWYGDPNRRDGTAAPTLGPIEGGPFYAVEVKSGALGTKGGPLTDAHGAVLHVDGHRIEGLYAAGNAMSSPMGMTYGGAGGTLGPAMIFGYLAGRDISRRLATSLPRTKAMEESIT
jgi:succinate dehydrogenase/fumarate reductase flavoprotein subunit